MSGLGTERAVRRADAAQKSAEGIVGEAVKPTEGPNGWKGE